MTKYKNGDRVRYVAQTMNDERRFRNGPLLGTVVDATEGRYDNISKIAWDSDKYPDHGKRSDMPYQYFELDEAAVTVRGIENLAPGTYETFYKGKSESKWLLPYDFKVETNEALGHEIQSVKAFALNGRPIKIYLGDVGITPRSRRKNTEVCNLGHRHAVKGEPVYESARYTVKIA